MKTKTNTRRTQMAKEIVRLATRGPLMNAQRSQFWALYLTRKGQTIADSIGDTMSEREQLSTAYRALDAGY